MALEATTGWRFVVEELRRIGAGVHLAEPAETSALRGNKKRAKNDRADARHLRELLMAGGCRSRGSRPITSLISAPRVRLRHALVHERGEWQQRMHAVLYHHGLPKRAGPAHAREPRLGRGAGAAGRRTRADHGRAGDDRRGRRAAGAVRQGAVLVRSPAAGCKALIGPLRDRRADSVTILAELGDVSGSRPRARRSATPGWTSLCTPPIKRRAPGHLSRQGPPALRWALYEAAQAASRPGSPDRAYFLQAAERLGGNRACLALARKLLKRSYHTLRDLGEEATRARMSCPRARTPPVTPMHRGQLPAFRCRHARVDGLQRLSGRTATSPSGNPITIMSPAREQPRSWTEISMGARAHTTSR